MKAVNDFDKDLPEKFSKTRLASFKDELGYLINKYSKENESNTPDYILADYIQDCLEAFTKCSRAREKWYGKTLEI